MNRVGLSKSFNKRDWRCKGEEIKHRVFLGSHQVFWKQYNITKKLSGYFVDNVNGEEIGRNRFAFQESCAVINYALFNYEMNNRIREIIVDINCSPSLVSYD